MILSDEQRISYYLGYENLNFKEEPFDFSPHELFDHPFCVDARNKQCLSRAHYDPDIIKYVSLNNLEKLWFCCGDKPYTGVNYPVLVKTRDTFNKLSKGVIANLNSGRHWNLDLSQDIEWNDKKNEVFWRGADTGHDIHCNDRIGFVSKYFSEHDVAFSDYSQNYKSAPYLYKKEWLKGFCTRQDFLKRKFLPILDGNDKSSSLNWILASNSVPIMPKPRFHSWLCEDFLESGVHYIEVQPDFSDLNIVLDWCRENDEECESIAKNGAKFISENFTNQETETRIIKSLLEFIRSGLYDIKNKG